MEEQVQCPWAPVPGGNVSMLAAGPSQGSLPFPHVQTKSNCSHHQFKLENGHTLAHVCHVREGRTPDALEAASLPPGPWARVRGSTHPPYVLSPGPSSLLLEAP